MHDAPKDVIDAARRRARGASTNGTNRFERFQHESFDDGWDIPEDLPPLRTEVRLERARSLISYNKSPDLPFDRTLNPYRGCEHGCVYCFARPSHAYLGLSPGLDFETQLIARPNAPEILDQELRRKRYQVAPIAIGTNTDPYQPIERDQKVMRRCLEVLSDFNHPVAIVTKGTLIERDLDILAPMAAKGLVRVGVSVTSLDPVLSRKMEPRVPVPARRLQTIRRLHEAGIPVRLMVAPVVPALTDPELEAILEAGQAAGAEAATWIMLRLPREVSDLFQTWLQEQFPDRANRVMARLREMHGGKTYDAQWGRRMRGEGIYADLIANRFKLAAKRLGLDQEQPRLRCDLFRPPAKPGDQLGLFD
ncbi:MAG: PA0069 family radical SAM protein [Thalassovita sp.]